ncbi:MAG: NAD(P)H-binding protein [bacterium]
MSIVINTPNGHIGRALALHLLGAGAPLTVISRDAARVADLAARGARVVVGSIEDAATLDAAFAGAEQLFWLTPPTYRPDFRAWVQGLSAQAAARAAAHGIGRVVVLSSVGAHNRDTEGHLGPVGALLDVEDAFRAQVRDVLALRPAFFMENLVREVDTLRATGTYFTVAPIDAAFPPVATADIARRAADAPAGRHLERPVPGRARPAGCDLRRDRPPDRRGRRAPVQAVQVTLDQAHRAMAQAGAPGFVVELMGNLYAGFEDGGWRPPSRATPSPPRGRTSPPSCATPSSPL